MPCISITAYYPTWVLPPGAVQRWLCCKCLSCCSERNQKGFPCGSVVKNPPASTRDAGSIPGLGRSPGGGQVNPLQYSCLENSMDRGTWWSTVYRVTQRWTRLMTGHARTHKAANHKVPDWVKMPWFARWWPAQHHDGSLKTGCRASIKNPLAPSAFLCRIHDSV